MLVFQRHTTLPTSQEHTFSLLRTLHLYGTQPHSSGHAVLGPSNTHLNLGDTLLWRTRLLGSWHTIPLRVTTLQAPHSITFTTLSAPRYTLSHSTTPHTPNQTHIHTTLHNLPSNTPLQHLIFPTLLRPFFRSFLHTHHAALQHALSLQNIKPEKKPENCSNILDLTAP